MDPVSPLPAIACLLAAIGTAFLLVKRFGTPPDQGRYATIDGLRGYLAFFVFLHHASIWYFYLHTGQWEAPPSNLYTHFGQSSVSLFFMITGFLFFSKLIDGRTRRIDWGKLFVSRLLRLMPLYFFLMILLFMVVAALSHGILHDPVAKLAKGMALWLALTIRGAPDLNGIQNTPVIVAGVTWTLAYECLFYAALPLLALSVGAKPPLRYLALGLVGTLGLLAAWHPESTYLRPFLGGIAASFLVRSDAFRRFAGRRVSSFIVLGCMALTVAAYPSAYGYAPLLLLSLAFALVASGNKLFGVLVSPVSRTLGEISYSLYLLHGITLYIAFNFILGISGARAITPTMHWLLVAGITPLLVSVCFVTFRLIERPAMQGAPALTAWLRSRSAPLFRRCASEPA